MTYSPTDSAAGETTVAVTMPQMGVSVAEGTIVKWHKRPGERVEADETVCEISTDKVEAEIPAPAAGRLVRILVEENDTVAVGTPIAEIDTAASSLPTGGPHDRASPSGDGADGADGDRRAIPPPEIDRSQVFSPVVQRMAAAHGIDLSAVEGTGIGGRIRKQDLVAYIESHPAAPEARPRPAHERHEPEAQPVRERREPLSVMRRQIAEHMMRSRRTAAHCTTVIEVDMTRVAERRAELRDAFAARGVRLTYLAFVARAAVAALLEHPRLNASLEADEIVYHDDVNLGIAVALDDGLIVPVLREAQRLSLEGTAAAIGDLSERARAKRLAPEDVEGGTFTITNPGQFGTVLATPIINQPQVAILDLEAVVKRPVAIERPEGDAVEIRPVVNLCLSFDHRALDGAQAARFLAAVKSRLRDWTDDA